MRVPLTVTVALGCAFVVASCSSSSSQDAGVSEDAASESGGSASGSGSSGSSGAASSSSSGGSGSTSSSSGGASSSGSSSGSSAGSGVAVGDPCTSDSQCPGISLEQGTCMTSWPGGGACTVVGCGVECPGNNTSCNVYQGQSYCTPNCEPGIINCTRPGYACVGGGCFPAGDGG